ncbi:NAD(P)/FAD-dependent oxidoreductase [Streptomyces sp. NA04227]|uniref:flavin-containing monooxygenase n=1 Tax=Streptomyces sp. NA04227 TaxID=2742136 RepID=UPI00159170BC|nr:NAD(P)/FAD-dependent oxidoreductase [Streptomyces sp. NA04227]QKW08415.1 NAD(P)/FAD-dependent oxidoreductase [Streptomyces sp. NA04227]
MSAQPSGKPSGEPSAPTEFEVLVIGAGISGVGAGVRLREAGIRDFLIIEAAEDFGGTWRANTYPGCQCDVPSRLYSYSFAPNPEWTRVYANQPEILAYVRQVADRHRLREHTRFGVRMTEAHWQPAQGRWLVRTTAGEFTARFLIAGAGPWNEPLTPEIPGLESFPGEVFHSARWNHDYDLSGKRVAVLGTGASAVQFVPAIAPRVDRLHLFQRTAQWVLPKLDHHIPKAERWAMRQLPGARAGLAAVEYRAMETLGRGFRKPGLMRGVQAVARAHLRATVRDRELRRKLTPDYTIGCKRILFSNYYYPALTRPNVEVHASAVRAVEGSTVVGADGSRAEVDAIILGTGFHILDMPLADHVHDGAGRTLADHWQGSPEAYLGTVTAGFPNAFLLLGPGLGTGHSSAFAILEAQLELVLGALRTARSSGSATIEVRAEVQAAFNKELQAALAGTVYNSGGCRSYYLDANGRNSFSWPWSTGQLRSRVGRFDSRDFTLTPSRARQESDV